jgi:hypothetical protein
MIIARGSNEETETLILGLSHKNVERLLAGQPIHIRRVSHGDGIPEGWEIILLVGETEETIVSQFRKLDIISESTPMIYDKQLGHPEKGT